MAAGIDTTELEITIKGLLISRPTVAKANFLQRECETELGKTFPFRQLGFPTFVDYLRSIPTIVQLEPHNGFNPDVYPVASRASRHIDQLVSKQRVPTTKRRGVARRGGYNSRPPVRRRTTARAAPPMVRPNQGVNVRDLGDYMRRNYDKGDLARNGIHSVDDLLDHANGMMDQGDTKVYPKLAGGSNNTDQSSKINGIPAGLEDDLDDFDDEYDDFYDEETEKDSEEELSKQAIQLWSRALGVEENGSSPRSLIPGDETSAVNSIGVESDQKVELPEDDDNISQTMINNFRKILTQHPDGIWASQLQQLYFNNFHVPLDILDLGHTSVISLATSLPSVFTFSREGPHDWKLYDARYITQESLDAQVNGGSLSENGRYMPQTIIENIKKLLDDNPNGFRSTDLLQLYTDTFRKPLNLEILGFDTMEKFLMILKNDVTLKKVTDYYLLLPKHKLISHDALEPPKPDERLIVPAEALCVPIPENVMRLGDEIPLQELPPVQTDPDKPLLEMEVRVAEVMSPVHFYMCLGSMYEELEKMMDDLEKFYYWEEGRFKIPLPHIAMDLYCAAKYADFWHRAKITRILNHGNVKIEYIDYGTPDTVKSSELRYLSKEFAYLPAQAICAKLIGVRPLNGENRFPPDVCREFLNLVEGKRLMAHVYEVAERVRFKQERMQLEVVLYDVENPKEERVLNDYLVENKLASPTYPTEDVLSEAQQDVGELGSGNDVNSPQPNDVSLLPPSSTSTSLPENDSAPLLENSSTSLSTSSRKQEEKKPSRPPPGFRELEMGVSNDPDFNLSTLPDSALPWTSSSSQTQPSTNWSPEEEQNILMNNMYLNWTPAQAQMLTWLQNYQQNLSNIPYGGSPLFQSHQNESQRSLTYGSVVPPPNAYNNPQARVYRQQEYQIAPPVPTGYLPMNHVVHYPPVHMMQPVPAGFILMNAVLPNQSVSVHPNMNVQGYGQGNFSSAQPSRQTVRSQCTPVPTPPPAKHSTASSPSPTFTPITIPQWPPENFPPSFTNAPSKNKAISCSHHSVPASPVKSQSPDINKVPRPCTPLTPASAEVDSICKLSRPSSSASHHSGSQSVNSQIDKHTASHNSGNQSINLHNDKRSASHNSGSQSVNSQNDKSPFDNPSCNSQTKSPVKNVNNFQNQKIDFRNFDPCSDSETCLEPSTEVKEIPLPLEIDPKRIPLPPPTPEKLHSAISSPVDSLILNSPMKEESSDDYVSASEILEESKQQLSKLMSVQHSIPALKSPCDPSNDIPDSWENLEIDDTPAKADNFSEDISQSLALIVKEFESQLTLNTDNLTEKPESKVINQESPLKIQVPINWKDGFNPDTISSSERVDNNNKVKGKSPSPVKFNVKKIPVQKIEIQGKFLHLLNINDTPAVVALEFFKQFAPNNSPALSEKVLEVSFNKLYFLTRAEYPAILDELNKVTEFYGGMQKKVVVRFNKVKVLNMSDIPQCLTVLNVPNKPLLEDLKTIANELASC